MKHKLAILATAISMINTASAATLIDLHKQPTTSLQKYFTPQTSLTGQGAQFHTVRTDVDFNQVAHTRLQQQYAGIPVWNATAIIHAPAKSSKNIYSLMSNPSQAKVDGKIYEGLEKDLYGSSNAINEIQKAKALELAKNTYFKNKKMSQVTKEETVKTIIFVNAKQQARFALLTSFYVEDLETGGHRPTMILDAQTLEVYRNWDGILYERSHVSSKTAEEFYPLAAGGVGGNEKVGEIHYDGNAEHLPTLNMNAFDQEYEVLPGQKIKVTTCFLFNDDVQVVDAAYGDMLVGNLCAPFNKVPWLSLDRNGTRWRSDEMNGAYSPSLDAFYTGNVIEKFYRDWYGVPALIENDHKTPMQLLMRVHFGRQFDNAFWDGKQMTFGDGGRMFYPLVSLDVAAHEVSHGFTQQHSDIDYSNNQMGALHEAFSDMASVAIRYFATGKIIWDLGRDITKGEGALRYLDQPTKDGYSLDNFKNYDEGIDPHLLAGVFNKAFYLISNAKGWDVRKAFNVMVKANMNYWSSSTGTLPEAACGVLKATEDYQYDVSAVKIAFAKVGIDTDQC